MFSISNKVEYLLLPMSTSLYGLHDNKFHQNMKKIYFLNFSIRVKHSNYGNRVRDTAVENACAPTISAILYPKSPIIQTFGLCGHRVVRNLNTPTIRNWQLRQASVLTSLLVKIRQCNC